MPAREVKVIEAAAYSPRSAVEHWWRYQQKMWHELRQPTIDFSPYRAGKWRDPVLDLRAGGAELSTVDPASGKAEWTPCEVSVLNFWGAEPNRPVWLRKRFEAPAEWSAQGGKIYLVSGAWAGPHYTGSARLSLNGKLLHDYPGGGHEDFDVTRLLAEGPNELVFQFKGDSKYQGIIGNVYLYHARPAARVVTLAGTWDAEDASGARKVVTLPGEARAWTPSRTMRIPAEWEGRYFVRLYMEGGHHDNAGAMVNGRFTRRHHHWFGTRCDIDITRFLRFGAENEIELVHVYGGGPRNPKRPPQWALKKVELHLFEKAE
jgi:hypothetical protein